MTVRKTERQKHPVKVAWKRMMVALRLHRSREQKAAVNWFTGTAAQRFIWRAAQPESPFVRKANPILWHYVGDTRDWLEQHTHLTGVGRVSIEIFKAALADASIRGASCVYDRKRGALTGLSHEAIGEILSRGNYAGDEQRTAMGQLAGKAIEALGPAPGDHVFFNGLVWTPVFEKIFIDLSKRGVSFSVLIHDIIPIERPDLVDAEYTASFEKWLVVAVNTVNCIFVSTNHVKDQIYRWALLAGVEIRGSILCVPFGQTALNRRSNPKQLERQNLLDKVEIGNFVLGVGTIDTRKNQTLLCEIWVRLIAKFGASEMPQLVLAGRDDIGVERLNEDVAALVRAGKICILDGLADGEIASLYASCLFTLFPSQSEGYGLPVAESLSFGRLCVASDLPVIRDHADGFPWYFPVGDLHAAEALIVRAIFQSEERHAAECAIRADYRPPAWSNTFAELAKHVRHVLEAPTRTVAFGRQRHVIDGTTDFSTAATLAMAMKWCVQDDPLVSILVVNWNAAALTLECIRQVWSQTSGATYEIVVVDNGSAESDLEHLRQLATGVRLIELGCNRFFGEANNIAAEAAKGKYICFLNNDAFVKDGWLTPLLEKLESDPETAATGPLFLYPNGIVQEAGAVIDRAGIPKRFGRGDLKPSQECLEEKQVDYISAALLLMSRDLFIYCGGFDMKYEPAYYEDTDLCFKLRALGKKVVYVPASRCVHIEGASANGDAAAEMRRKYLGDFNRDKFLSRWGAYLESGNAANLATAIPQFLWSSNPAPFAANIVSSEKPSAIIYTPFDLNPGGGERYLLSLGVALANYYNVTFATKLPYSRIRLQQLSCEFGIDFSRLALADEASILEGEKPSLFIAMGNHVIPPINPIGDTNIYHCQFPFEMDPPPSAAEFASLFRFQKVIVNSEFTRGHYLASLPVTADDNRLLVEVIPPAVPAYAGDAARKKKMILSVGRFFVGGHNKRQDAMIDAFKSVWRGPGDPLELHLAGAAVPNAECMDHLSRLVAAAEGYPIHFHVNAPREKLAELYRDSAIYWHAAGYGANLAAHPGRAEHFGISLVEAMSAQAVPIAFNAGGPAEIISHQINGLLYDTEQELIALTVGALNLDAEATRIKLARAAALRARDFSATAFENRVRDIVGS